jgi:prevent-host-death family protein
MMTVVNIHEAKTHFSKLINQALNGEEVIIARGGHPLIRLIPYEEVLTPRKGGQLAGMITIEEDFDAPLPDDMLWQ